MGCVRTDVLNIFLYNLLLSRRGLKVVIPDDSFERLPKKNQYLSYKVS